MKTTEHGIENSRDVENIHHMRLMALLQELVREKGYKGAARVLEIDPQTVTDSAKTGRLSRRVREALERALQEGVGSAAERQRRRNEELEGRIEALEKGYEELGKDLRRRMAGVEGEVCRSCGGTALVGPGPVRPAPVPPTPESSDELRKRPCVGPGQKPPVEAFDTAGVPRPGDA